jgi:alkylated DNA nucleotide flippase Atl1
MFATSGSARLASRTVWKVDTEAEQPPRWWRLLRCSGPAVAAALAAADEAALACPEGYELPATHAWA